MANTPSSKHSDKETTFVCGEALDVICIANLHQSLKAAIEKRKDFVLDASKVERVDTAALQLLCAFTEHAIGSGLGFRWCDPSPEVREAARTLGVLEKLFPDQRNDGDESPGSESDGAALQPEGIG